MAWVQFPGLEVLKSAQQYERLAGDRWRFSTGDFRPSCWSIPTVWCSTTVGCSARWPTGPAEPGPARVDPWAWA